MDRETVVLLLLSLLVTGFFLFVLNFFISTLLDHSRKTEELKLRRYELAIRREELRLQREGADNDEDERNS